MIFFHHDIHHIILFRLFAKLLYIGKTASLLNIKYSLTSSKQSTKVLPIHDILYYPSFSILKLSSWKKYTTKQINPLKNINILILFSNSVQQLLQLRDKRISNNVRLYELFELRTRTSKTSVSVYATSNFSSSHFPIEHNLIRTKENKLLITKFEV